MKRTTSLRRDEGYTLIELLVVLGILGLLAAVATPGYMHYLESGRVKTARTEIANIGVGLDLYKADIGRYPTTEEGLAALITAPESEANWDGPYLKKRGGIVDPWGKPYRYKAPGDHDDFDLYSYGPSEDTSGKPVVENW
jgi:general secretion pathway protein G